MPSFACTVNTINKNFNVLADGNNSVDNNFTSILEEFKDVFQGVGNIQKAPCDLELQEGYQGVRCSNTLQKS